ncbi:MAG: cytochrome c [Reichenbachiella sp.]|uniref:c-type cytochrome n=1 Tax=Reichenbachiella sp. TaxID=2184521 RepID=UPI0029671FCC|nr:cytochrome c [Reichenbachiella sp.]MDW3209322.1 cytochrome c [Reichenbachiella sp.]
MKKSIRIILLCYCAIAVLQCTPPSNPCDPMQNIGIGPIEKLDLQPVNTNMAAEGQKIYDQLCRVCHNEIRQMEGPAHWGIMNRRTPEWVMNMMLNPKEMSQKDPIAKILAERVNGVEMADMNLSEEEARKILEYFRTLQ